MKKSTLTIIGVIIGIILLIGITIGSTYNSILNKSEDVEGMYANIDSQLQRRNDLIPNLVNTVKGFASQEKEVINSVTEARSKLAGAQSIEEKSKADSELSSALSRLLVVVENYPELKSNQNFMQLSDELAGTENRIQVARKNYNDAVKGYNLKIKKFPSNIIANMFGFEAKSYFEASEESKNVPNVQF